VWGKIFHHDITFVQPSMVVNNFAGRCKTLVMVRLGFQLDRLATRRSFNARVSEQVGQSPLMLSSESFTQNGFKLDDLVWMEYRQVIVTGVYDTEQEVALRNQVWHDQYGVLTPPQRINSRILSLWLIGVGSPVRISLLVNPTGIGPSTRNQVW
jgi:cytochrome oxidase assembly protein ShyY1